MKPCFNCNRESTHTLPIVIRYRGQFRIRLDPTELQEHPACVICFTKYVTDEALEMQKCRNAEMQKCRNAEMQKCRNAEMQKGKTR